MLRTEAHLVAAEDAVERDRGDQRKSGFGQIEDLHRAVAVAGPQLVVIGREHPVGAVAVVAAWLHAWCSTGPSLTRCRRYHAGELIGPDSVRESIGPSVDDVDLIVGAIAQEKLAERRIVPADVPRCEHVGGISGWVVWDNDSCRHAIGLVGREG